MARQGLPATPAGTRTSPRNKTKRHAHTSINSEPESPSTRAKRKRNAATAHAKGAAGNKRAKPKATGVQEIPADKNTKESDPVHFATKPHKKNALSLLLVRRGSKSHQKRRRQKADGTLLRKLMTRCTQMRRLTRKRTDWAMTRMTKKI